jgi:anti-sigma-K factor RskA
METVDLLLSDEFVSFSSEIQRIFEEKKSKTAAFKALHDEWKSSMAELDAEAKEAQNKWEIFKNSKTK